MPRGKKDKNKVEGNEAGGGEPLEPKASKKQHASSTTGEKTKSEKKKDKKGKSWKLSKSSSPELLEDDSYEIEVLKEHPQKINQPLPKSKRNRTKFCSDRRHSP